MKLPGLKDEGLYHWIENEDIVVKNKRARGRSVNHFWQLQRRVTARNIYWRSSHSLFTGSSEIVCDFTETLMLLKMYLTTWWSKENWEEWNRECVKETTTRQRSKKQPKATNGPSYNKKIPQAEAVFRRHLNKNVYLDCNSLRQSLYKMELAILSGCFSIYFFFGFYKSLAFKWLALSFPDEGKSRKARRTHAIYITCRFHFFKRK